jgi:hypothetical protein
MFEWINKQGVKSATGFTLQRQDRSHYKFSDGDIELLLEVEPGTVEDIYYLNSCSGLWRL